MKLPSDFAPIWVGGSSEAPLVSSMWYLPVTFLCFSAGGIVTFLGAELLHKSLKNENNDGILGRIDTSLNNLQKFSTSTTKVHSLFNSFLASGGFCCLLTTLCKQFGPRSGPTECQSWSGSKLFDTCKFGKKSADDKKAWKITQHEKS